jgi:hypothetical protein
MAEAYQVSAAGQKTVTTGTTFTIALETTAGDQVVVGVAYLSGSAQVTGITDTNGNVYHRINNGSNGSTIEIELWKTDAVTPLDTGGTITITMNTGFVAAAVAASYRGTAFFGGPTATTTGTTSPITSNATSLYEAGNWLVFVGATNANNPFTQSNGQLRVQGGTTGVAICLIDSNGASGSPTCSATMTAATWVGMRAQLRPLNGLVDQMVMGDAVAQQLISNLDTVSLTSELDLVIS